MSLPNAEITAAHVVDAGRFTVPANAARSGGGSSVLAGTIGPVPDVPGRVTANTAGLGLGYNGGKGVPPFTSLPAFCRVTATLRPSAASNIRMELWLPIAGWNGHFRGTSPNGLGGVINYNAMGVGLTDGFAVASTDTGHQGGDTGWMQVPDQVTDFAGRAMHETTVAGKALTMAYYGTAPRFSYMIECGGGSAAALHEVQKYPADYNGVVVGGHAAHLTRQMFGQLWLWGATHPNGVAILPSAKLPVLHAAVLDKCDALDGVKDGLLENPVRCAFDPKEIECKAADGPDCLSAPQVDAVRKIYAGPTNPRTASASGRRSIAGANSTGASSPSPRAPSVSRRARFATRFSRTRPGTTAPRPVDFDRHVALADRSDIARVNASNPDISAYRATRRQADSLGRLEQRAGAGGSGVGLLPAGRSRDRP